MITNGRSPISLTPRFSGVYRLPGGHENRFNGFLQSKCHVNSYRSTSFRNSSVKLLLRWCSSWPAI